MVYGSVRRAVERAIELTSGDILAQDYSVTIEPTAAAIARYLRSSRNACMLYSECSDVTIEVHDVY